MGILEELKQLFKASIAIICDIWRLAKLELRLAKKSAITIGCLSFIAFIFIAAIWIFLNALLIVYLASKGVHVEFSLLIALGIHVLFLIIIVLLIRRYVKHLTFPATRKQLRRS